jgi:type VI secretion system protein ImpB
MAPTSPKTRPNNAADEDTTVAGRLRVNIVYSTSSPPTEEVELPMKILFVGDHTGDEDPRPLEARRTVPLDKERFDAAMAAHALRLDLTVPDRLTPTVTGERDVALRFERLADFTPERVASQVPEMRRLLEVRSALNALKGPLAAVPAFKKRLSVMLHSHEGRARLTRVFGVELAGSVGWLGLPRFRWGSLDMFAILEKYVEPERSVFVARMEVRLGANLVGAFEVARSEHPIAFVSFATESRSWLVAHLEVLDGGHAFPLTLVLNAAGRIPCAFLGVLRGQAHFTENAFAAILDPAHHYGRMVPVHVDLTTGEVRAAFDLDVIAAPLGAGASTPWILLGGGARLHALRG